VSEVLFHEVQRPRQWWIWLLVALSLLGSWLLFAEQIILGAELGENPAPDFVVWIIWLVLGVALPLLFALLKLEVDVLAEGRLRVRFFPFFTKTILPKTITKSYARVYHPIWEYGGWGIRWSIRNGWAYNIRGDQGVQLQFTDGKKLLIGSQRPGELAAAIEQISKRRRKKKR
jgi:hypothetical protein